MNLKLGNPMSATHHITIAAALLMDDNKNILLVRKRGSPFFMQPGGKIDQDETPEEALIRELNEELQLVIKREELVAMGCFHDIAANETDHQLTAHLFRIQRESFTPIPAAEIEEAVWLSQDECQHITLAPLTENQLLPLAWPR